MHEPKCETCKFFVFFGDSDNGGFCHRYPPRDWDSDESFFPLVQITDWCGEHVEREAK